MVKSTKYSTSSKSLPRMPHRTSPKIAKRSPAGGAGVGAGVGAGGKGGGRNHTGQSTLPPSPSNGPGSASSTTKSTNGSLRSDDELDGDNINVVVRVRPLNAREVKNDDSSIIQFPGDGGIWVDEQKSDKPRPFTFNVVFEPEASQEDIVEHSGIKRLIEMAVDGFSTTCFCYGQTGSGKTHTLTGPPHLYQSKRMDPLHPDHGLVFRSFIYLFEELKRRSDDATYIIKASYLEIYNEKVLDLLNPGTKRSNLNVRWDKKSRAFLVDNLFSIDCTELDDLVAVLEEGLKNRAIGTHNMNEHSSRSHTILTVHIFSEEKAESAGTKGVYLTRHGKINFVDLAGSEMTKKTRSEGKTLEEANNINKSLMVLGYCIAQLSSQKKSDRGVHIPYRDSKLTKLLADSLAGNGVTLMIACVSPAKSNQSETSNTLRYAARAKKIKTKPVVVMDPREALIVSLKREVNILYQENNHLRQLLELADSSDSNGSASASASTAGDPAAAAANSAAMMAQLGMDRSGSAPLDGRAVGTNGHTHHAHNGHAHPAETLLSGDLDYDDELLLMHQQPDGPPGSSGSRPASQRSHDTLRQVSSLLFIATPATVKRIDKSKLNDLESSTLVDLIKDYMSENQELRKENQDLFSVRDLLLRDQELVCRENERLLRKLEDVTSVCCRSPIVPVRPIYSAELLSNSMAMGLNSLPRSSGATGSAPDLSSPLGGRNSSSSSNGAGAGAGGGTSPDGNYNNADTLSQRTLTPSQSTQSLGGQPSRLPHRLPPTINKELEKRKIGNSLTNIADSYRDKSHRKDRSTNRKGSGGSEVSTDELFTLQASSSTAAAVASASHRHRRPVGHLKDNLAAASAASAAANGSSGSNPSLNSADDRESRSRRGSFRKERTKKLREKSRSKERSRMGDASKF